jgi:hypothetical protein
MKRAFLIIVIAAVLIVGGLFAFAISNANSLIASFKPELEKVAGEAVGGKVTIGAIEASIFPSARFSLQDLRVSSQDESEPFTLRDIALDVELLALLKGKLEVSSFTILSPTIALVKDSTGTWVSGLPRGKSSGEKSSPSPAPTEENTSARDASSTASPPLDLGLKSFRLKDATITLDDRLGNKKYVLDQVNLDTSVELSGKNFTLPQLNASARANGNIPLSIQGSSLGLAGKDFSAEKLAISILGNTLIFKAKLNLDSQEGHISLEGPGLSLEAFKPLLSLAAAPDLQAKGLLGITAQATLGGAQKGYQSEGALSLKQVSATANNFQIADLTGDLTSSAQGKLVQFGTKKIGLSLNGQPLSVAFAGTFSSPQVKVSEFNSSLFSGTLTSSAELSLEGKQAFSASFSASGLNVGQALLATGQKPADQKFSATIDSVKGNVSGPLAGPLPHALSGNANLSLSNVEVKGVNLAGSVLKALKGLPFVSGALYDALPPDQKGELDSPDTALSKVTGSFTFSDGLIRTPDLKAFSNLFDLEADGTVGFNAEVDLNATILFNPTTSAALAKKVKELESVLDAKGRLVVPLTLKGTAQKLTVVPNIDRLMKTGAKKMLQDKASDLLEKALKGKKGEGGKKGLGGLLGF